MASRKKIRIQTLVVGCIVFLALNCVYVMGQPWFQDTTNNPPQITSVRLVNDEDEYRMEVEAEDEDSNSLKINVQHEGGKPGWIIFPDPSIRLIDNKATFISEPFFLEPGSQVFIITVGDSDNNSCAMSVTFDIQGPAIEHPENLPPQILSIEYRSEQNMQDYYILIVEIMDEDPDTVQVELEGSSIQFNRVGATFMSQPFHLPSGSNQLTIIARDSQGQQARLQMTIDIPKTIIQPPEPDQLPQITSLEFRNEQKNYILIVEVEDKNPESVYVQVDNKTNLRFEKEVAQSISDDMKRCVFVSYPVDLISGSHLFTIVAEGSDGRQTRMKMTVVVPEISVQAAAENQAPRIISIGFRNDNSKYVMTIKGEDEDSYILEIEVQHGENEPNELEFPKPIIPISEIVKRGVFSSHPFALDPGSHVFRVIIRDAENNQAEMLISLQVPETTPIEGNQIPQILSVRFDCEQKYYTLELKIKDEDPASLGISIKENPEIEFKKGSVVPILSDNTMMGIFVSDPFQLDPGSHTFTITVDDTEYKIEMQTTIAMPKPTADPVRGFLLILSLALIVVVIMLFYSRGKTERQNIKGILYCKQCSAPIIPSDDLEREKILEDVRKKLDEGEITEDEYYRIVESLKEGFQS